MKWLVSFASKVKGIIIWVRALPPDDRKLVYALIFLFAIIVACFTKAALGADRPLYGWQLMEQSFNAMDGDLDGPARFIPCRADVDYVKGVIVSQKDCWPNGQYKTVAECKKSVGGNRIGLYRQGARKWAGVLLYCEHKRRPGARA